MSLVKEVASLNEEPPDRLEINSDEVSLVQIEQEIRATKSEAIVMWTGSILANQLVPRVRQIRASMPIYLCQKAADFLPDAGDEIAPSQAATTFTVDTRIKDVDLSKRYKQLAGEYPGLAAQQVNRSVRMITEAVRRAGNNRARVRDELTANGVGQTTARLVSFDEAGNEREQVRLVRIDAHVGVSVAP